MKIVMKNPKYPEQSMEYSIKDFIDMLNYCQNDGYPDGLTIGDIITVEDGEAEEFEDDDIGDWDMRTKTDKEWVDNYNQKNNLTKE